MLKKTYSKINLTGPGATRLLGPFSTTSIHQDQEPPAYQNARVTWRSHFSPILLLFIFNELSVYTILKVFFISHVSLLLYIELLFHELSRAKLSSFLLLSSICVQHSNQHTRTLNILMPVGLHHFTMQMQVRRISTPHFVDLD